MRRSSKRGLGLVGKSSRSKKHDENIDFDEQYENDYDEYEDEYEEEYDDVDDRDYYEDDRDYDESDYRRERDREYEDEDYDREHYQDEEYERETDGIIDDEYDRDYEDDRDYYEEDYEDGYDDEEVYEGDEDFRDVDEIDARRDYEEEDYYEDDEDYDDDYEYDRRERGHRKKSSSYRYDEPDNERNGIFGVILNSSAVERIAALIFIVLIVGAVATGVFYKKAMEKNSEINSFAEVGENYGEIEMVGEAGLIAVADAEKAKLAAAEVVSEDEESEEEEKEETKEEAVTSVSMSVTTIKSDIKIKFINSKTNKLVASVPFTVTVKNPDGSTVTFDDHDQDGIIYKKDLTAGKYTITPVALSTDYSKYTLDTSAKAVTVKNTVEMKAVDVSNEVKKESEVNVAKEDTAVADKVESALTDTVEWVESTKSTEGEGQDSGDYTYEVVDKSNIIDPSASAMNGTSKFMFLAFAATPEENLEQNDEDKEFKLNKYEVTLKIGETTKIEVTDGPSDIKFSSSDTNLVRVSEDGTITAVGESTDGEYITITADGYQKEIVKVIVKKSDDSSSSSSSSSSSTNSNSSSSSSSSGSTNTSTDGKGSPISVTKVTIVKGHTFKFEPKDSGVSLKISSSDTGKVSVDGTTIKGEDAGETSVTVGADGYSDTKVTVIVKSTSEKLVTKDGKPVYIKTSEGNYEEADYGDYYIDQTFYLRSGASSYKYTGWQTIGGKTYYYDKNGNPVTGDQIIQGAKYSFGSDGALATGSVMGIDVSKWNGNIDWEAVKNSGVNFVIIRCGYRGSSEGLLIEDSKFKSNIKGAQAAGLKVGVYFFTQAVNEVEAVEEASMVISLIKGYSLSYPVYLDVEKSNGRGDGISAEQRTANIKAFCGTVANAGYSVGVYSNKTWFTEKMSVSSLSSYKIWLAQYAASVDYSGSKYDMWQYTSKGKVTGISGNVDMNICY